MFPALYTLLCATVISTIYCQNFLFLTILLSCRLYCRLVMPVPTLSLIYLLLKRYHKKYSNTSICFWTVFITYNYFLGLTSIFWTWYNINVSWNYISTNIIHMMLLYSHLLNFYIHWNMLPSNYWFWSFPSVQKQISTDFYGQTQMNEHFTGSYFTCIVYRY